MDRRNTKLESWAEMSAQLDRWEKRMLRDWDTDTRCECQCKCSSRSSSRDEEVRDRDRDRDMW